MFPAADAGPAGLEFSFSGLKTAVLHAVRDRVLDDTLRADVARGVQEAIVECLCVKALRALEETDCEVLTVSGGVGANAHLRATLSRLLVSRGGRAYYPRPEFCTDNAAMIAVAGPRAAACGPAR